MLKLILCEDDRGQRERFERIVKAIIEENKYNCEIILSTSNPYEVIRYAKNHSKEIIAYYFDVDLKNDINGVETAKQIKEVNKESIFIFVTDHPEYSSMAFEYYLNAIDYISKADISKMDERIHKSIELVYEKYTQSLNKVDIYEPTFIFKSGIRQYNIPFREILYFETLDNHKIKLHTINSQYEFYATISDTLDKLNESCFCRTHSAFIVNKCHIAEVTNKEIILDNGDICLVSKKYREGLGDNRW